MITRACSFLLALLLATGVARADVLAGSNDTTGYVTQGQAQANMGESWVGYTHTVTTSGNVTSICLYSHWNHSDNLRFLLTDNAGTVLVASALASTTSAGSAGWVCGTTSSTAVTATQVIYVMITGDAVDTGRIPMMSNGTNGAYLASEGSATSPPASVTLSFDGGTTRPLVYIDGTPTGGGGAQAKRSMNQFRQRN